MTETQTPPPTEPSAVAKIVAEMEAAAPRMLTVTTKALAWKGRSAEAGTMIRTEVELTHVTESRRMAKADLEAVGAVFNPLCSMANELHKALTGSRGRAEAPLKAEIAVYDTLILDYEARVEREAREEAERHAALAEIQAEDSVVDEAARLEAEAEATGDETLRAQAHELIANPPPPPLAPPPRRAMPPARALGGTTVPKKWKAFVTNAHAFILAIARPFIYQEVAAALRTDSTLAPTVTAAHRDIVAAALLERVVAMPRPGATLLEINGPALDREATNRKFAGEIFPGVTAKQVGHVRG